MPPSTDDLFASLGAVVDSASLLGPAEADRVYGANVTEFRPRTLLGVLRARSVDDVRAALEVAHRLGVPVYPLATGRNWGVGSKLPVRDGAFIIDMSGMRALSVDDARGVALVEPGVTQRQLWEELESRGGQWILNVTGSGENVSVLGNALERGVGMLGHRHRDVRALEVVTPPGRTIRTGLWSAWTGAASTFPFHLPEGLGPDLTGLFVQSNLGIVTRMVIGLAPQRRVTVALLRIRQQALSAVVDALAALRRERVLEDRIELDGDNDPRLFGIDGAGAEQSADPTWWAWVPLFGDDPFVQAASDALARRVGSGAAIRYFASDSPELDAFPEPARVRLARLRGEPGNHSLDSIARACGVPVSAGLDLDHEPRIPGFVCALPAVPFDGLSVNTAIAVVRHTAARCAVDAYVSFNSVSTALLEGYVRVMFDRRDPAAVARAQRWADDVHDALAQRGLLPLRLDVERMARFADIVGPDVAATIHALKQALDPNGILAPGRYAP